MELIEKDLEVPAEILYKDDDGVERSIVPFMAGKTLKWSIKN